jgi:hypothetical protein
MKLEIGGQFCLVCVGEKKVWSCILFTNINVRVSLYGYKSGVYAIIRQHNTI